MKKILVLVMCALLAGNANAQFGGFAKKLKKAASSALQKETKKATKEVSKTAKEVSEDPTAVASATPAVGGKMVGGIRKSTINYEQVPDSKLENSTAMGIEGNYFTSWSNHSNFRLQRTLSHGNFLKALVHNLRIEKYALEQGDLDYLISNEESSREFIKGYKRNSHMDYYNAGSLKDQQKEKALCDAAIEYWENQIDENGWWNYETLAGINVVDRPAASSKEPKTVYELAMWYVKKAQQENRDKVKFWLTRQAYRIYTEACAESEEMSNTGNTPEYAEFIEAYRAIQNGTYEQQKAIDYYVYALNDPKTYWNENQEYLKTRAEIIATNKELRDHSQEKTLRVLNSKRGMRNAQLEALAAKMYEERLPGKKVMYTVIYSRDYAHHKEGLFNSIIVDRYLIFCSVVKNQKGEFYYQNYSIKWLYDGNNYSNVPLFHGLGMSVPVDDWK